jgi:selenocysteine lyase/cysteine desulfurase
MNLGPAFERLIPSIRSQFPQVDQVRAGRLRIYLDSAAGTLVPQSVADALADAALWANPQPGRFWPAGPATKREHAKTRAMLGEFLNAVAGDRLFLSESTTASLYKLREALEPEWQATDNLVVTDCDHFANISPWEWRASWEVRRARMLPDGHLDLDHLAALLDSRTRVVALTMAGNALGTVTRLEAAVPLIRQRAFEAVVVVDAVHAAPHLPIDVEALGVDALAFSTYKLFGPLCGVLWLSERLLPRLSPYHVEPHTESETLMEWGTLNNASVSGIRAALEYLLRLGERLEPAAVGQFSGLGRERRQYKIALAAIRQYELSLARRVLEGWRADEPGRMLGVCDPDRIDERVPTFAFSIHGREDAELEAAFWEGGVQVGVGSHYSAAVRRGLGRSSVARASFAHYNSMDEVDAFLAAARAVRR